MKVGFVELRIAFLLCRIYRAQGVRLILQQTKATVHSMARYERWKVDLDDRTGAVTKLVSFLATAFLFRA